MKRVAFRRTWRAPRRLIAFACASAVLAAPACRDDAALVERRPRHLFLVTVDTLRADHLTYHGYSRGTSDAAGADSRGSIAGFTIDELARQGVAFTNAIAPRGETFPSISTLFTGRTPIENCVIANQATLGPEVETLAERLRDAGFKTAAFTTNKLLVPRSGVDQGFDSFFTDFSEEREARAVEAAMQWIRAQDKDQRLFVWLHLMGPHLPYDPRPIGALDFASLFTDPAYTGQADGSRAFLDRAYSEGRELDPADVERVVALYDGEIARIDHWVSRFARFCAGLEPHQPVDLLSDALFVFTADHGEELHQRNRYWAHSKSVYGSVLHVPLFMRHPASLPAGRSVDAVIELEDVLPTLVAAFDLQSGARMHGRSLAPLLSHASDGATFADEPAFSLWRDRIFSVRSRQWRLVWNPERIEPQEMPPGPYPVPELALFDISVDPLETTDVAAQHPAVVALLQRQLQEWARAQTPCARQSQAVTPERLQALRDLGYAGDER